MKVMTDTPDPKKQQYRRLVEIFNTARQRYLDDGGDPHKAGGGLSGKDYLTEEEKKEIRYLGDQVFGSNSSQDNTSSQRVS